ncbi:LOW QUALITY PROTEIN: melatonin receptor type 1B [Antechinus flavipes]|uniref:LOW QUALITY PROTEIN: melatonin receptor type 1B n=1 Tax=Antechinus flavipes TaxID=38775 RepID=UPI0022357FC9|nr:LOW QUALITY PROTEIN: melatonin receptor type 1B [Antechinus flavipes]
MCEMICPWISSSLLQHGLLRQEQFGRTFGWEEAEAGDWTQPSLASRPFWVTTALSSVLIIITTIDFVGNSLVILSVLRNRKIRNTGNMFLVNLALADLAVALYPYPLILMGIFHNDWALSEIHCKTSGFVMGLSVLGSVFNITAIAINRYCCICHSLGYHKIYRAWNTTLHVCLIWVFMVIALVPNFFVGSLKYEPRIYSCTFIQTANAHYTIAVVGIHFLVPITIVTYCYLRIWVLVIQSRRRVKLAIKPRLKLSEVWNFLTMFVVFVIFAICGAPLNFIGLAIAINPLDMASQVPDGLFTTSYFLAYFNNCLNVIIYGLFNQNFWKEYKKILLFLWIPRYFFQDSSKDGTNNQRNSLMLYT